MHGRRQAVTFVLYLFAHVATTTIATTGIGAHLLRVTRLYAMSRRAHQDDYKISSNLTVNLGLRYEYATPPVEKGNRLVNFDPATGTEVFATDGDTYDRTLIHPDDNNIAPRLGFAYAPARRWVVRGAYGVFYSHTVRQGREGMLGFNPPHLVDNLLQTTVSGAGAGKLAPAPCSFTASPPSDPPDGGGPPQADSITANTEQRAVDLDNLIWNFPLESESPPMAPARVYLAQVVQLRRYEHVTAA
jgi:hypothetical protein